MSHSFSIDARRLIDDLGGVSALYEKLKSEFPEMRLTSPKTIEKWRERGQMTLENFMRCRKVGKAIDVTVDLDKYVKGE